MMIKVLLSFVCLFLVHFVQGVSADLNKDIISDRTQLDTGLVKKYILLGDQLKNIRSDSGIYYYRKSLTEVESTGLKDKLTTYYIALSHFKLASLFVDLHQVEDAGLHNVTAVYSATKIGSTRLLAELLNNRGAIFLIKSNYDSATLFFNKALKSAKELAYPSLEARLYINLGKIKTNQGDSDSAIIYFDKALAIAQKLGDKEILASAYSSIGRVFSSAGKLDLALTNLEMSRKLYEEINDQFDLILCELNIANVYYFRADYVSALERYSALIDKCLKVNNQIQLAKVYHNIGQCYYDIYAFGEATTYFLKAIEIKQKLNDKLGLSSDYSSLGSVQISSENPAKALGYYRKSMAILEEINNKPALARIYNNMGNAFIELNVKDSIAYYLNKAGDLAKKISEPYTLSTNYFSFAQFYLNLGNFEKSLWYYNEIVKLNESLGDVESPAMANYKIASIYNTLGKKEKSANQNKKHFLRAIQYASRAYKSAEENQILEVRAEASKQLKEAYEGLGDLKKALYYYDIHTIAMDSLYKKTQSEAAINSEARWQADKKQRQINFLEEEKKLKDELIRTKESESRQQKLAIYLLITGLLIVVTSVGVFTYFLRKQRRLEFQQQLNKMSMLRLENARGRVSPHFLFNSLSSIQDELSDKPEVSKRLDAIVNMLRCSLLNIEKPYISLKEEMEFVENYILLQKLDHLKTEINLGIPGLDNLKIPAMIVQIPVENAIKHGLAGKLSGEKILKVNAKVENGLLRVSIIDNGIGRNNAGLESKVKGTGTGLKVISQTLHLLNSKNQEKIDFALVDLKDETGKNCGTEVDISIPLAYNFEILN